MVPTPSCRIGRFRNDVQIRVITNYRYLGLPLQTKGRITRLNRGENDDSLGDEELLLTLNERNSESGLVPVLAGAIDASRRVRGPKPKTPSSYPLARAPTALWDVFSYRAMLRCPALQTRSLVALTNPSPFEAAYRLQVRLPQ